MSRTTTLLALLAVGGSSGRQECVDESPYCNANDCSMRPGYALQFCRKTCGNCTEVCKDSVYVNCGAERKKDCDAMLRDYCPLLCGACRPRKLAAKRIKTIPVTDLVWKSPNVTTISNVSKFATTNSPSTSTLTTITTAAAAATSATNDPMTNDLIDGAPKLTEPLLPSFQHGETNQFTSGFASPNANLVEGIQPHENELHSFELPIIRPLLPEPEPTSLLPIHPYAFPQPEPQRLLPHSAFYPSSSIDIRRSPSPAFPMATMPFRPRVAASYPSMSPSGLIHPLQNMQKIGRPQAEFRAESDIPPPPQPLQMAEDPTMPMRIADLVSFLGCRDREPSVCSRVTAETCLARPGFYMKLCPVTCKNCNGLQCLDSTKIDCAEVERHGACKLPAAAEYCPRTCGLCPPPPGLTESLSVCRDELDTCQHLAESGACQHSYSRPALRMYCARSCGFCRDPQYYFADSPLKSFVKQPLNRQFHFQSG